MTGLLWFCLHLPPDSRQISQNTFPDPQPGQWQHSVDQAHRTQWDHDRFCFSRFTMSDYKLKVFSRLGRQTGSDRTLSSSAAEALRLMLAVVCLEKNRKRSRTHPWVFIKKGIRAVCPSHRARDFPLAQWATFAKCHHPVAPSNSYNAESNDSANCQPATNTPLGLQETRHISKVKNGAKLNK